MAKDFRERRDGDQEDLWIVHKSARLGAYQQLAEDAWAYLNAGWWENGRVGPELSKLITTCLRNSAEELGQLQQREAVTGQLTVKLEGVDLEAL